MSMGKQLNIANYPAIKGWEADTTFSDKNANILPALLQALNHYSLEYRQAADAALEDPNTMAIFEAQKWLIVKDTLLAVLACSAVESRAGNFPGDDGLALIQHIDELLCVIKPPLTATGVND